jgi:hypothetical protein
MACPCPAKKTTVNPLIEGRERESAFIDGIWHDDVMMAILDHEYAEIQRGKA